MSKLKTVWDAVNELRGDLNNTYLFDADDIYLHCYIDDSDYICNTFISDSDDEQLVCAIAEFNALVEDMATNFDECPIVDCELYQSADKTLLEKETKPVYTNEMRDDDILPDIGTDCLLSKSRPSGNGYPGYIAGEDAGELIYITSHFKTREGLEMASYFGVNKRFGGVACAIAFEAIDTRTKKEKAIDEFMAKNLKGGIAFKHLISKAYDEFTGE